MTPPRPRPEVLGLAPYVGGEAALPGIQKPIRLAANENPLGPSPKAIAAIAEALSGAHRYPDGASTALRTAIAELHGLDVDRIVCGCGSDELITLLCRAYLGPGDEIVYNAHGFLMFPIAARGVGAVPVTAPEQDLTADVDALLAAVTERTRIVFLANPNNPTGTCLPDSEIRRLREGLPPDILLVLDGAYAEFVERDDYDAGARMVDAGGDTVMLRTFSKVYGLGGARLGWAYGPPVVVDALNRLRNPFNVTATAQAAGLAAVADQEYIARSVAHVVQWRDWLTARLRGLGLIVPESSGNFVLARFPGSAGSNRDARAADAFLRGRGIIVRRMDSYGLSDALRITIGTDEETAAVATALEAFLTNGGGA